MSNPQFPMPWSPNVAAHRAMLKRLPTSVRSPELESHLLVIGMVAANLALVADIMGGLCLAGLEPNLGDDSPVLDWLTKHSPDFRFLLSSTYCTLFYEQDFVLGRKGQRTLIEALEDLLSMTYRALVCFDYPA